MFYYVLCSLVVCLWICGSQGKYDFEIIRRRQDIFKNFGCQSSPSEECSCEYENTECVNASCEYCRCSESHNTFMVTDYDPTDGVCKRDEEIVPTSVPNKAFKLMHKEHETCVKSNLENEYIIGGDCHLDSHRLSTDMLWILLTVSEEERLIINVKTLKCIERQDESSNVVLGQCQKISDQQKNQCHQYYEHNYYIWGFEWDNNKYLRLPRKYPQGQGYAILDSRNKRWSTWQAWSWRKSDWIETNSCETEKAYAGCYRFSDGSFMKYLNYSEPTFELQISAPIFKENDRNCNVDDVFQCIRDGWNWKATGGGRSLFSIKSKTKSSKVITIKSMYLLRQWNGSLVKLNVSCHEEQHCVLLKLQTFFQKPSPEVPPTSSTDTKIENSNLDLSEESSGEENPTAVAVSVTITLLLVALAVAIGVLVYYRKRKRTQVPQNNANNLGVVNYNKEIYEDPDRNYEKIKEDATCSQTFPTNSDTDRELITNTITPEYETLKENGNEVSFNPPGTSSGANTHKHGNSGTNTDIPRKPEETKMAPVRGPELYHTLEQPPSDDFYNYIDNTKIKKPSASPELEYTYSKDTGIPKNPQQTKVAPTGPAVYETLENPSSDDVYNYIDNTNIAKPVTSEQEYTYATDTNLPRAGQNGKGEPPASDAVYHTLEQDQPLPSSSEISSEMEYSYAKSTDLPRKPSATNDNEYCITDVSSMGVQQNNTGSCAPPTDNDLYHTLEEPNQPNVPVYSTLEEGDAENA